MVDTWSKLEGRSMAEKSKTMTLSRDKGHLSRACIICKEPTINEYEHVCEKCKKAILNIRNNNKNIVYCGECKHRDGLNCTGRFFGMKPESNFFCADGERD